VNNDSDYRGSPYRNALYSVIFPGEPGKPTISRSFIRIYNRTEEALPCSPGGGQPASCFASATRKYPEKSMLNGESRTERLLRLFEIVIIAALLLLLTMLIVVSTITIYGLFVEGVRDNFGEIGSAEDLHGLLQRAIGGVLIVLLGLELMETLKSYFSEQHIRVEVILVVAIIAVGRQIIKLDFDHVSPSLLFALSALMIGLTAGYFLIRWSNSSAKG
jgi:uncharacterized membrane protein (DUF373 family)